MMAQKEGGVFLKCEALAVADALAGIKKFLFVFFFPFAMLQ
jgi:hypothetical protein